MKDISFIDTALLVIMFILHFFVYFSLNTRGFSPPVSYAQELPFRICSFKQYSNEPCIKNTTTRYGRLNVVINITAAIFCNRVVRVFRLNGTFFDTMTYSIAVVTTDGCFRVWWVYQLHIWKWVWKIVCSKWLG